MIPSMSSDDLRSWILVHKRGTKGRIAVHSLNSSIARMGLQRASNGVGWKGVCMIYEFGERMSTRPGGQKLFR